MNATQLNQQITDEIKGSNKQVQDHAVWALISKEIERRSDAIVKGLGQLADLHLEARKTKPDFVSFTAAGEQVGEGAAYTKATADKLKQTNEKIIKLEKALNKGLENGDYGDLFNLVNKSA